jgi:hypothetical protein
MTLGETNPVAYPIIRADINEGTHATLEQSGNIIRRREDRVLALCEPHADFVVAA